MISDKFRKLLRDESKLKEAKKICENAGYIVTENSIKGLSSSSFFIYINKAIKLAKEASTDSDGFEYGHAICNIMSTCLEAIKNIPHEYVSDYDAKEAQLERILPKIEEIERDIENLSREF